MVVVSSFYDYWILRYSTNRIFLIFNFEIWTRTVRSDQFWLDWIWTDLILIRFRLIWTDLIGSKFFWTESELQIRYIWSDLIWQIRFKSDPIRSVFFRSTSYKYMRNILRSNEPNRTNERTYDEAKNNKKFGKFKFKFKTLHKCKCLN